MIQTIDTGPTSHHFMSQRLRLHYLDWGNPDAPTLVLQHGGRDHARSWDDVARALRHEWHVVCPDLRGHGDSDWSPDGAYLPPYYSYDMAQFIHQLGGGPVSMIAHSLGGNIAIRHAALFPETIAKLVLVEGLVSPLASSEQADPPGFTRRWRDWIENRRGSAGRSARRYPSIEAALARMIEANPHLTQAQARHLTVHGMIRNEDGTLSWKFDDYMRHWGPMEVSEADQQALWAAIECPILMAYGRDSWATDPETDGRIRHFRDARVMLFDNAGHWPHHDRFDAFVAAVRDFL